MKLKDIVACPWNARKITPENVAELAASIKDQGLLQPVIVWKDGDGRWVCIAGNRRLAALRALGKKEIDDNLVTDFEGDEAQAREITITENLQREGLGLLEEAAAVTALLTDFGHTVKTAAATLGKSEAWVRRRAKLADLDAAWKERADQTDADALERIATYPTDVQARAAKKVGAGAKSWREMAWVFNAESRDLTSVKFDCADCAACMKRTGVEADLFGEADGALGRCLDCACFNAKAKQWERDEIARLVGDAEVVRVKGYWQFPDEAGGKKRDKKHPCAYVNVTGDEIAVKWGPSKKSIEEANEKADEERRLANAERDAERERRDSVIDAISEATSQTEDGAWPKGLTEAAAKFVSADLPKKVRERVTDIIAEWFGQWHNEMDTADILRDFDFVAELAGIGADDKKWFVAKFGGEE